MDLLDRVGARLLRTRAFVRAPIGLYRHGFGWLLGSRILMLEHVGRSSGLPRYVCLEVVERPTANEITIVSGFGKQAQWYRNITEYPHCHVSVGRLRRAPAMVSLLGEHESAETLERYQRAHPRAWAHLKSTIEGATGTGADTLPMVRLSINPEGSAQ